MFGARRGFPGGLAASCLWLVAGCQGEGCGGQGAARAGTEPSLPSLLEWHDCAPDLLVCSQGELLLSQAARVPAGGACPPPRSLGMCPGRCVAEDAWVGMEYAVEHAHQLCADPPVLYLQRASRAGAPPDASPRCQPPGRLHTVEVEVQCARGCAIEAAEVEPAAWPPAQLAALFCVREIADPDASSPLLAPPFEAPVAD